LHNTIYRGRGSRVLHDVAWWVMRASSFWVVLIGSFLNNYIFYTVKKFGKLYPTPLHIYLHPNIWHKLPSLPFYIKQNTITFSVFTPTYTSCAFTPFLEKNFFYFAYASNKQYKPPFICSLHVSVFFSVFVLLIVYQNHWLRFSRVF